MNLFIDIRTNKIYQRKFKRYNKNVAGNGFVYFESWDGKKSRLTNEEGVCHFESTKEFPKSLVPFKVNFATS
jgi:hypothetical protein